MGLFRELKDTITTAFQQSKLFRAAVTAAGLTAGVGLWTLYAPTAKRDFRSPILDQPEGKRIAQLIDQKLLDPEIAEFYLYGKAMRHLIYEGGSPADYTELTERVRQQLNERDDYVYWNRVNDMGQLPYTAPAEWLDRRVGTKLHDALHTDRPGVDIFIAKQQTGYEERFIKVVEAIQNGKTFPQDPYKNEEGLSIDAQERRYIALGVVDMTRSAEIIVRATELLADPNARVTTDEPIIERFVAGRDQFDKFYYDIDRVLGRAQMRKDEETLQRLDTLFRKELVIEDSRGQTMRIAYTEFPKMHFGLRLAEILENLIKTTGHTVEITGEFADVTPPEKPAAPAPKPGRGR